MHTPGPWSVWIDGLRVGIEDAAKRDLARVSWHDRSDKHFPLKDEALANASLFAAAPDMYEALEAVAAQLAVQRTWIKNWSPSFESEDEYIGDAALADQALEKALAAFAKVSQQTDTPQSQGQQNEGAES